MRGRLLAYGLRHLQVLFYSFGQLARAPVASLMSIAVVGISLALPSGLYITISNIERLSGGWKTGGQISLFMKRGAAPAKVEKLADQIRRRPAVARVEHITPEAALAEFKQLSGFGEALEALGENPLPAVLVVQPAPDRSTPEQLEALARELGEDKDIDLVQLDLEWVRRLQAMLRLVERGIWLLGVFLATAVVLIVGNTIRLAVLNRREEIAIIKLIGGTDAFIRRPFLYSGAIQGLSGALLAWLLISLAAALLAEPVRQLAALYGSNFRIAGLGVDTGLGLLGLGGMLGWLGSRFAVGRHLRHIEPS